MFKVNYYIIKASKSNKYVETTGNFAYTWYECIANPAKRKINLHSPCVAFQSQTISQDGTELYFMVFLIEADNIYIYLD